MSKLTDTLEPGTQGLLITTGALNKSSRFFLWYEGRPRSTYTVPFYAHRPFQHNGTLHYLTGYQEEGHLERCDVATPDGVVFSDAKYLQRVIPHRGGLVGLQKGDRWVDNRNTWTNGYNESEVFSLATQQVLHTLPETMEIASSGGELYALHVDDKEPSGLVRVRRGLDELCKGFWFGGMAAHRDGVVLGGVGTLAAVDREVVEQSHNRLAATAYKRSFTAYIRSRFEGYREHDPDRAFALAAARTLGMTPALEQEFSATNYLYHTFLVKHLVSYNDRVLYSIGKRLFMDRERQWTFSLPITGLAVVEGEPLKELRGRTSVRRGVSKARSFALAA
jgi:hypothetical protein